jgi:hypothetical protein
MTILVIAAAATWAMVGVIWMVQLVHYPMLAGYSALLPGAAAIDHQRRITWLVGPLMATESVTALLLLVERPDTMATWSAWLAAGLLAVALGSTVCVQVPLHARLALGHDEGVAARLVVSNWIRTVAWTLRGCVVAWVIAT